MKHIVVGDVHSNHLALIKIMFKYPPSEYKYIFTGDYNDYREENPREKSNYITTIFQVMKIVNLHGGVALLGNHDDKLRRWFNGRNVEIRDGLTETIYDIEKFRKEPYGQLHLDTINAFLNNLPLTHIEEINGIVYKFAHAIHPEYDEVYIQTGHNPPSEKKWKEHCIWGYPRTLDDEKVFHRVHYWNIKEYNDRVPENTFKIAGHYHEVFKNDKFLILDATPNIATYIIEDNLIEEW
jgi:hypothetical protein